jgi:hypothetical protein
LVKRQPQIGKRRVRAGDVCENEPNSRSLLPGKAAKVLLRRCGSIEDSNGAVGIRPQGPVEASSGRVFSMSGAKHEGYVGPNDPAYYAPRDLKERGADEPSSKVPVQTEERRSRTTTEEQPLKPARRSEMFTKAVAQAMQEAMQSTPVEAPSVLRDMSGRRALVSQAIRFSIAVAVAASIATLLVMAIPASQRPAGQSAASQSAANQSAASQPAASQSTASQSNDAASVSAAWQSMKSSIMPAPSPKRVATLSVQDGSGLVNDSLPLGIHVGAPPPGSTVSIGGLPAGAQLTSGKRIGPNEWRVSASEVSGVSVIPPNGFVGQMQLTAELRDGDGAALTGTSTRLSWTAPVVTAPVVAAAAIAAPAPAAVIAAPAPAAPAAASPALREFMRTLDQKEVAALVRRGQDLLASGDVQSARLLLMRGAEARDARAALLVGTTYDPVLLKQLGANGPLADVAQARLWYQRAKEWGEPDAQRQLDALVLAR